MCDFKKLRNMYVLVFVFVVFGSGIAEANEEVRRVGVIVVSPASSGYTVSVNAEPNKGAAKILRALSSQYKDSDDYLAILVQEDTSVSGITEVVMMAVKVGFRKQNIFLFSFRKKDFLLSLRSYDTYKYTTSPLEIRNYLANIK